MMQRATGYGEAMTSRQAVSVLEISRVIGRQTGEAQVEVFKRYLDTAAVINVQQRVKAATKGGDEADSFGRGRS